MRKILLVSLSIIMAGCTSTPLKEKRVWTESAFDGPGRTVSDNGEEMSPVLANQEEPRLQFSEGYSSQLVAPNFEDESLNFSDEMNITLAIEDMPLKEFINHALSEVLAVNFLIDPKLSSISEQKITLNILEPIDQNEFYRLFKETITSYGIGIMKRKNIFYVHSVNNGGHYEKIRIGVGGLIEDLPLTAEFVNQIIPLSYVSPDVIRKFIPQVTLAAVKPFDNGNYVIVEGRRNDVIRAMKVVKFLDVPSAISSNVAFYKTKFVEPQLLVDQIYELFRAEGINVEGLIKLTPLLRQNGIVVHTSSEKLLKRFEFWKDSLDNSEASGDKRYLLYFPENSKASELASGLARLLSLENPQANNSASYSPATRSSSSGNATGGGATQGQTSTRNRSVNKPSTSFSSELLSMVADDNRNALIFYTEPSKYQSLLPVIRQLDVLPSQVLIEAKFIEVTLTDKFSNGVEWAFQNGLNSITTSAKGGLNNGSFSYSVSGLDYEFALNFLQQNNQIKVLSSPRVIAIDGKSANITVGTDIPILISENSDLDSNRVTQNIQYRTTGVALNVTPTVNSQGVVSMEIAQSITEVSEDSAGSSTAPIILNRSFNSELIARNGQTIVLGGLIRENKSLSDNQVPILGDIPVVGNLFSTESDSITRTELILLITPRIIQTTNDLDDIRGIFLDEMNSLN